MMARMNAAAAMCINMIFFCFLGASMGATGENCGPAAKQLYSVNLRIHCSQRSLGLSKTLFVLVAIFVAAVPAKKASFYDALVADSANHRMILSAISNDAATKAMLKLPLNVTAFVPTDKVGRLCHS